MVHSKGKGSVDLRALLRRAHGINSSSRISENQHQGLARTVHKWDEQMAEIMTVQLEKLEEINAIVNLLKSGYGQIDAKIEKIQFDMTVLQARHGNDTSSSQTEIGVQNQGSKDKMIDEGGESSDSDESEQNSRGDRIADISA